MFRFTTSLFPLDPTEWNNEARPLDRVVEQEVSTIEEFFYHSSLVLSAQTYLEKDAIADPPVFWRGQSDPSWTLCSPLERSFGVDTASRLKRKQSLGKDDWTRLLLRILQDYVADAEGRALTAEDALDPSVWGAGRHFGLNGPFLDWTGSPFVALFFALSAYYRGLSKGAGVAPSDETTHVAVFRLIGYSSHDKSDDGTLRTHLPRAKLSPRERAQAALYTELNTPDAVDLESYLCEKGEAWRLTKFLIPISLAPVAVRYLNLMNIRHDTLLPDPEGFAAAANLEYGLRTAQLVQIHGRGLRVFQGLPEDGEEGHGPKAS